MTQSPILKTFDDFVAFKDAVEKSHRMMCGPDVGIDHIHKNPVMYPCIAISATTFKTKLAIFLGYMFVYPHDFDTL